MRLASNFFEHTAHVKWAFPSTTLVARPRYRVCFYPISGFSSFRVCDLRSQCYIILLSLRSCPPPRLYPNHSEPMPIFCNPFATRFWAFANPYFNRRDVADFTILPEWRLIQDITMYIWYSDDVRVLVVYLCGLRFKILNIVRVNGTYGNVDSYYANVIFVKRFN